MKRKKDYRSRSEKFFLDYLPNEIFNSLSKKERENYQKYRNHHKLIFGGNEKVKILEKEIKQRRDKIKNIKTQINGDDESSGWKQKMMIGYEGVQKYSKDFVFNISVGFRYRKSKILKNEEDFKSGKRGSKEDFRNQTTFKGKVIKSNPLLYLRVQRTRDVFKNLYVGKEEDVRIVLKNITKEEWKNFPIDDVKDEVRLLYSSYVRYFVHHSNWDKFFKEKHTLSVVEEWCKKLGDKIYLW